MHPSRWGTRPHAPVRAAAAVAALLAVGAVTAGPATAATPKPLLTVKAKPASVVAGSTGNAFTFNVRASGPATGQLSLLVPAGWTAPQSANSTQPGYVVIKKSTCASAGPFPVSIAGSGPWTLTFGFSCVSGTAFTISYGGKVASSKVTAPGTQTSYEFTAEADTGSGFTRLVSQPVVTTTAAPIHLVVSGIPDPASAGAANTFTVTARDAANNVVTSYGGAVHFTSSDGSAAVPANYAFTAADAGSHTFTGGATFATLGSQTLAATDIANASITGSQTVTVAAGPATHLVVSGLADPSTVGVAQALTVTAKDALGHTATGYTGTIAVGVTDPSALRPAAYTFTAMDAGSHTFSPGVNFLTPGSQTVSATDISAASITGSQTVTVQPGAATHLVVSGIADPSTAGIAGSFTVTARDLVGNTATSYRGTVHFTSSDPDAILPADYTFVAGDAGTHTFSTGLRTAGSQTVTATDTASASITGSQTVTVAPGPVAQLALSGLPNPSTAGVQDSFTLRAVDAFGNTVTGYRGSVHFTTSDVGALLPVDYTFTAADNGSHLFVNSAAFTVAGFQFLSATDDANPSVTGLEFVTVEAGPATRLVVNGLPDPSTIGVAESVTVTAQDLFGNTATGYRGTVHFISSDPGATLPPDYAFTAGDAGVHVFVNGVMFMSTGPQAVTATDTTNGSLTDSQFVTVQGPMYIVTIGDHANSGRSAVSAAIAP